MEDVTNGSVPMTSGSEREARLRRMLEIGLRMNEISDAEQLFEYVLDRFMALSEVDRGFLALVNDDGSVEFRAVQGISWGQGQSAESNLRSAVLGAVVRDKKPLLLPGSEDTELLGNLPHLSSLNLSSLLCLPLLAYDKLVGMLYVDRWLPAPPISEQETSLLTLFADHAATAIKNLQRYQENLEWTKTLEESITDCTDTLYRRALQIETSSQVGQQVTSILDLDEVLNRVVYLIREQFSYYFVGIFLMVDGGDALEYRTGVGRFGEELALRGLRLEMERVCLTTAACKTGEARVVNDVLEAADYLAVEDLPDTRSELSLPLRMGQQVIGVLDVQSERVSAFNSEDVQVLQNLADQIAVAIRNAQLYAAEQKRRQLAEALERAGRALSSSLNLYQVAEQILYQLSQVVPYDRGIVVLRRSETFEVVSEEGLESTSPYFSGVERLCQHTGEGARFIKVENFTFPSPEEEGVDFETIWLRLPMIFKGTVLGFLVLARERVSPFNSKEITAASAFAAQSAIALENARLYEEIHRFNEQLEEMVDQRTEELKRAYATLERMDKTKSDFIDVAAHELRTPLTLIRGYSQLLKPLVNETPRMASIVEGILQGQERLHEIINSLLDVSKISSQVLEVCPETIYVQDVISRVYRGYQNAWAERNLSFSSVNLDELPPISADPELLDKVFYHLVGNAIKYTPDGGMVTLSGSLIDVDADHRLVEVLVVDTGIGIDPEHHELIFDEFYQTGKVQFHSSGKTKFKGGGPGLGLSIARGIVEAHHGRIWVESPGHDEETCPGSVFHVVLPLEQPQEENTVRIASEPETE